MESTLIMKIWSLTSNIALLMKEQDGQRPDTLKYLPEGSILEKLLLIFG